MNKELSAKKMEERIVELEQERAHYKSLAEKYQTLFDTFPQGISVSDRHGAILETNILAEKILGINKSEHEKRSIDGPEWQIIRPDGSEMPPEEWPSVVSLKENRVVTNHEMGVQRSDGEISWLSVTASPLPLENHGVVITYSDITSGKQAEEERLKEQDKYQRLFESHIDAIYLLSDKGEILDANRAACKSLGRSKSELVSLDIQDIDLHFDSKSFRSLWSGAPKEQVLIFESSHVKADGTVFPVEVIGIPFREGDKRLLYGFARDITDRIQAGKAIRESEEKFRSIFEQAGDYILILEPQPNGSPTIVDANQSAADKHGYTLDELIGKPISLLDREVNPQAASERSRKLLSDGHILFEIIHHRKDGSTFPVEVSATMIRNTSDNKMLALCMERDISDRKEAEKRLQELEERFRLTFHTSPDAVNINKMDGTYLEINEGFTQLTGYTREDAIGKTSGDIKIWDIPEDREKLLESLQKDGYVRNLESRFLMKDGSYKIALMSATIIYLKGEPHILSITRDITDFRKAENDKLELASQLQQAQKMESVGRLAGGIAHDLNNMLGPIFGYGEMLLEDLSQEDPRHDAAQQIMNAATRAQAIVRQLLAFSRKQTLEIKYVDVNALLSGFEKLLRRTLREDILIHMELANSLSPIKADIGQLEQVIMNLAINAQDAMPSGGSLVFKTKMVELNDQLADRSPKIIPGKYVMLSVTDNGFGMDEETKRNIFEPFFTTKETHQGTGLGLSTAYGIIKQHNGYIWVTSGSRQGTTFEINLPAAHGAECQTEKTCDDKRMARGDETILLVEDELPLREMTKTLLTRQGYQVLAAANGVEAVKLCEEYDGDIDLLLTDVVMPGIDGKETAMHVKKHFPHIKVLYISGYTDDVISTRGILDTEAVLLQKPFTRNTILNKINFLLDKGRVKAK